MSSHKSAQGTIEDKLRLILHRLWKEDGDWKPAIDQIQAIITTENTKARIDELNRLPRHSKDRWPTSPEFDNVRLALHVPNRLNALQKEQK